MKDCKVCGNPIKAKPSHYEKKVYCSRKCMAEDYKVRLAGESNPHFSRADEKTCELCGNAYKSYNKKQRYCSKKCGHATAETRNKIREARLRHYYPDQYPPLPPKEPPKKKIDEPIPVNQIKQAYLWRGMGVEHNYHWKRRPKAIHCKTCNRIFIPRDNQKRCEECRYTTTACAWCGKSFTAATWLHQLTCSDKCAAKYRGANQSGENSHFWRGGVSSEEELLRASVEYAAWRRQVFKRDNRTCQLCSYKRNLQAHHIKMVVTHFHLALDVSNGITLCKKCHESIRHKEHLYEPQFYAILNR